MLEQLSPPLRDKFYQGVGPQYELSNKKQYAHMNNHMSHNAVFPRPDTTHEEEFSTKHVPRPKRRVRFFDALRSQSHTENKQQIVI